MTSRILERLRCPVCGAAGGSDEAEKVFSCHGAKKHCFDFAKSGYLNLCLNGKEGDSKAAVQARSLFLEAGYYQPLSDALNGLLDEIGAETVLDAGSGEGYYTNRMARDGREVLGADLSRFGVDHGAKTAKRLGCGASFAVASVYTLPVESGSFDAVTNLFAPCAEEEFCRVLKTGGTLILVGAGERHLMGLKSLLYDNPYLNLGRNDLPKQMRLCKELHIRETVTVKGNDMICALFSMTPYYWRTSERDISKLNGVERLETELDFDIFVYRKELD